MKCEHFLPVLFFSNGVIWSYFYVVKLFIWEGAFRFQVMVTKDIPKTILLKQQDNITPLFKNSSVVFPLTWIQTHNYEASYMISSPNICLKLSPTLSPSSTSF